MTDFNQAANWLYAFDGTNLSSQAQAMMLFIEADLGKSGWQAAPKWPSSSAGTGSPANVEQATAQFKAYTTKSSDPMEYPEALVLLARYYFNKGGMAEEALAMLNEADIAYKKIPLPDFLRAVVSWLKGCAARQAGDTYLAHIHCQAAIAGFEEIRATAKTGGRFLPAYGVFCDEKLQEMKLALHLFPEEAYTWMDEVILPWSKEFGGGNHMNKPTEELKAVLLSRYLEDDYRGVYADMEKFCRISKESVYSLNKEKIYCEADALVFMAMLLFWMGNTKEARNKLCAALDKYIPDTHPEAVVYWMMGLMYMFPPNDKRKVVDFCQRSIHTFKRVKFLANAKRNQDAYSWYTEKIDMLEETLRLIEGKIFS